MNNENKLFHFTVGELVAALKNFPQDLPILTSGYEEGFENIHLPEIKTLRHEPENKYYEGEFEFADINDKDTFQAVVLQRVVRDTL